MTPHGARLEQHLRESIAELSSRVANKDQSMRGIQRLANAAGNMMQQADREADAAAAELEAAYADQADVAKQYSAFAKQVAQSAQEARANLAQLTNLPTPPVSDGSEKPPE